MRKLYALLFVTVYLVSCEDQRLNSDANKLNLVTPTGESLAKNANQLNNWTTKVVQSKYPGYKNFEITDIRYLTVQQGYVAKINYKVDNTTSNYFYVGTSPTNANDAVKGRIEMMGCKWYSSCGGDTCCSSNYDPESGTITCSCSDSICTIILTCVEP
jgi:hypothetical protein